MDKWIFQTSNLETISLHDMVVNKIRVVNNDINLIFNNGFAVTKENKQNDTGRHLQTGVSIIILCRGSFLGGKDCENETQLTEEEVFSNELEILRDTINSNTFNIFYSSHKHVFCEATFSFTKIACCWNEYVGNAWFEGLGEKN